VRLVPARIEHVIFGRLLEVARDRVKSQALGRGHVRAADDSRRREHPAGRGISQERGRVR
jgi:hypothetical protein